MFYLQLAATTHGLDETFAFYSVSLMTPEQCIQDNSLIHDHQLVILNGCGFVARILCGFIARKISVIHLAIAAATVCGCITFAFVAIGSATSIVLVGVLYGTFAGICEPSSSFNRTGLGDWLT
jgi:hypothetical protein